MSVQPGWYQSPSCRYQMRWWDGYEWQDRYDRPLPEVDASMTSRKAFRRASRQLKAAHRALAPMPRLRNASISGQHSPRQSADELRRIRDHAKPFFEDAEDLGILSETMGEQESSKSLRFDARLEAVETLLMEIDLLIERLDGVAGPPGPVRPA